MSSLANRIKSNALPVEIAKVGLACFGFSAQSFVVPKRQISDTSVQAGHRMCNFHRRTHPSSDFVRGDSKIVSDPWSCSFANRVKSMLASARQRATKHDVPFDLTQQQVDTLAQRTVMCPALTDLKLKYLPGPICGASASLDRFDPQLGYVWDNVWIISMRANQIKSNATAVQILTVARWFNSKTTSGNIPAELLETVDTIVEGAE